MVNSSIRQKYQSDRRGMIAVVVLITLNSAVELVLMAADFGLIGDPYWRSNAYRYAAFQNQVLAGDYRYFPGQSAAMFVSYSVLHGGWLHLLLNMVALASFGKSIANSVGTSKFIWGYMLCAIGGAAAFAMLSTSTVPMVGASGALFGLLGIWIGWGYLERRDYGEGLSEIWRALFILVAYNIAFWLLLSGRLAWETHLGGFVVGWILAMVWGRPVYRRKRRNRTA